MPRKNVRLMDRLHHCQQVLRRNANIIDAPESPQGLHLCVLEISYFITDQATGAPQSTAIVRVANKPLFAHIAQVLALLGRKW